jgi:hypothetical protein
MRDAAKDERQSFVSRYSLFTPAHAPDAAAAAAPLPLADVYAADAAAMPDAIDARPAAATIVAATPLLRFRRCAADAPRCRCRRHYAADITASVAPLILRAMKRCAAMKDSRAGDAR